MEDSPLVSPNIKEYCAKFNIENILNEAVNEVLTKFPSDPFSLICGYLKKVRKIKINFIFLLYIVQSINIQNRKNRITPKTNVGINFSLSL